MSLDNVKKNIFEHIKQFYGLKKENEKFIPGETYIGYSGQIIDEKEVISAVETLLDGWFGLGKKGQLFEEEFSKFIGSKSSVLVNSGSSANLITISSILSEHFKNKLKAGDEVITPAVTFPTTLNPILQHNLKPVFLDVKIGNYNIDVENLEDTISKKTKLIVIPHTLGNPNDMDIIMEVAEKHNIMIIEDNCDALGSTYKNKKTGSFGLMSTCSFYPAHHITLGEGGIVTINDDNINLEKIVRSIRDWGRACYCKLDEKNSNGACNNRFGFKINGIPYDHKYMYTNIGYNLKPLELQAAIGLIQLKKLPEFIESRKRNFKTLYQEFQKHEQYFILPEATKNSDPSWFVFPITIKDGAPFSRFEITDWLENNKIQTRFLFAGNIIHQPAYKNINYRAVNNLKCSDKIMHDTFFLGVYPGIDDNRINYIIEKINEFIKKKR